MVLIVVLYGVNCGALWCKLWCFMVLIVVLLVLIVVFYGVSCGALWCKLWCFWC